MSGYYEEDKTSLIKRSLKELYEDIVDRQVIDDYENREKADSVSFVSAADALKNIGRRQVMPKPTQPSDSGERGSE